MNDKKKKRIKIVVLLTLGTLFAILLILILSKKVANPITKDAQQRTQFFVDLGNLLPKKKNVIHNGTGDDQNGNNTATSTDGGTIFGGGGGTNPVIVYTPTKDTNGDGKVTIQDAVIDTNGDGTVSSEDTPAEVLNDQQTPEESSGPTPIGDSGNGSGGSDTNKDNISTKDLVITSRQTEGVIKGTINLDWSSPTKANFTACTGSYAGSVWQQSELKKKKIKLTALAQKTIYDWDGTQLAPTIPRSKKVHVPYGEKDKSIIYVITCDKEIVTVLPPDLPVLGIPSTPIVSAGARVAGGLSGAPSTPVVSTSGSPATSTSSTSCPPTPPGTPPVPCTPSAPSSPSGPTAPGAPSGPTGPSVPGAPTPPSAPSIPGTTLPPGAPALPKTVITYEKVTAQVGITLVDKLKGDGTGGGGGGTGNKTCADYPKAVSDLMPECNSSADDTKDLLLVPSKDTFAKNEKISLTWFSPAGTEFWFCTGTGGADAGLPSTTLSWVFTKLPPTPLDPVHQFEEILDGRLKTVTYGLSCTTKAGKVVLTSTTVDVDDGTNGGGGGGDLDFCEGLPDNLKKLYCPDTDPIPDIDTTDPDFNDPNANKCPEGTSGQRTPLVLTPSEQAEYDKILRSFLRLLPQIRTPEAITGIGHDIEDLKNNGNYLKELTTMCEEQTIQSETDFKALKNTSNRDKYEETLYQQLDRSPKRRIAPFVVDYNTIKDFDQASASGDDEDTKYCRFPNGKGFWEKWKGNTMIIPWTHIPGDVHYSDANNSDKDLNHVGGYYGWTPNGSKITNPRSAATSEVFTNLGEQDSQAGKGPKWNPVLGHIQGAFETYWPNATDQNSLGIGFNCLSDLGKYYMGQDGDHDLGHTYDYGEKFLGKANGDWRTWNQCGFSPEFETIFGIKP